MTKRHSFSKVACLDHWSATRRGKLPPLTQGLTEVWRHPRVWNIYWNVSLSLSLSLSFSLPASCHSLIAWESYAERTTRRCSLARSLSSLEKRCEEFVSRCRARVCVCVRVCVTEKGEEKEKEKKRKKPERKQKKKQTNQWVSGVRWNEWVTWASVNIVFVYDRRESYFVFVLFVCVGSV